MTTTQSLVCKLHFSYASRQIWVALSNGDVARYDSFEHVASRLWSKGDPGPIYLFGTADNAVLICKLFDQFLQRSQQPQIYLGTPAIIPERLAWVLPASVFAGMDQLQLRRPSLGGWHLLTQKELPAYQLVSLLGRHGDDRSPGRLDQQVVAVLELHPAFHALSFFDSLDWLHAARLLAAIVDPRWYVDPENPDRLSKLRLYLGLTRQNAREVCTGDGRGGLNHCRSRFAFLSWQPGNALTTSPADVLLPQHFLYRFCRNRVSKRESLVDAILRTTQLLTRFIVDVWLAKIATHPELMSTDHLFDGDEPALRDATRKAFRQHMLPPTTG